MYRSCISNFVEDCDSLILKHLLCLQVRAAFSLRRVIGLVCILDISFLIHMFEKTSIFYCDKFLTSDTGYSGDFVG